MSGWTRVIVTSVLMVLIALFILWRPGQVQIEGRTVEFDTEGVVFVDDNKDFTSPEVVMPRHSVNLTPGKYYWKTEESEVKSFVLKSRVEVSKNNGKIKNTGNTKIGVSTITGFGVLDVNEKKKVGNETVEVYQYE